jgi:sec-independent protein translocase protein TatB
MFDVGFAEIFLLVLIGLLVLGPERLPGVARTLGGFVRKARMSWVSLRNTIESELAEADLARPIKKTSEELKQIGRDLTDIPGFKPGNQKPGTAAPDPKPATPPEPGPLPESDSGKSENA